MISLYTVFHVSILNIFMAIKHLNIISLTINLDYNLSIIFTLLP